MRPICAFPPPCMRLPGVCLPGLSVCLSVSVITAFSLHCLTALPLSPYCLTALAFSALLASLASLPHGLASVLPTEPCCTPFSRYPFTGPYLSSPPPCCVCLVLFCLSVYLCPCLSVCLCLSACPLLPCLSPPVCLSAPVLPVRLSSPAPSFFVPTRCLFCACS